MSSWLSFALRFLRSSSSRSLSRASALPEKAFSNIGPSSRHSRRCSSDGDVLVVFSPDDVVEHQRDQDWSWSSTKIRLFAKSSECSLSGAKERLGRLCRLGSNTVMILNLTPRFLPLQALCEDRGGAAASGRFGSGPSLCSSQRPAPSGVSGRRFCLSTLYHLETVFLGSFAVGGPKFLPMETTSALPFPSPRAFFISRSIIMATTSRLAHLCTSPGSLGRDHHPGSRPAS